MLLRISVVTWLVLLAGCAAQFPEPTGSRDHASAAEVLDRSIEAHGGYLFDQAGSVRVSYDGEWRNVVKVLQPVLVDAGYRQQSEEMLDLATAGIVQVHNGPDGTKLVARTAADVSVMYDDVESDDETTRAASALVADAYTMFLTGPSFIRQRNAELTLLEPATRDGESYQRIHAVLEPGFGFSERDEAVLWINEQTGYLGLAHFTIEGLASTRGAHVDVAFSKYEEIDGFVWPTEFYERVRAPLRVAAHSWHITELEVSGDSVDEYLARTDATD
ncbi:MAG: hypothetical protein QNJ23_06820 [Woeseiaceae bacterium]|nr:hypothetical protein [Woeseiaceae bacterium]